MRYLIFWFLSRAPSVDFLIADLGRDTNFNDVGEVEGGMGEAVEMIPVHGYDHAPRGHDGEGDVEGPEDSEGERGRRLLAAPRPVHHGVEGNGFVAGGMDEADGGVELVFLGVSEVDAEDIGLGGGAAQADWPADAGLAGQREGHAVSGVLVSPQPLLALSALEYRQKRESVLQKRNPQ